MYLGQRIAAIVLTLGLSTSLIGCGFHLRGMNPIDAPVYSKLKISVPPASDTLEEKLSIYLSSAGVNLSNDPNAKTLNILEYTPSSLDLNGKLRENILRLSVTFRIDDADGNPITEPRTVMATRSFQYDSATVNTENQERNHIYQILIDDVSQQIVRQISSNRLQTVQTVTP